MDDTGTATLKNADPNRPVTCLCGVIFKDDYYRNDVITSISKFKNQFLKNINIPLHRREIHQATGTFHGLRNQKKATRFHAEINNTFRNLDFKIIAVVVNILEFREWKKAGYYFPELPSDDYCRVFALAVERFTRFLLDISEVSNESPKGQIVIEQKGKKEDRSLKQYYETQLISYGTQYYAPHLFQKVLSPALTIQPKTANDCGLQVADWIAWPMAHIVESPNHDISSDVRYKGINEWQLYKDKIWIGRNPHEPGNSGLKTVPDSSLGRSLLNIPLKAQRPTEYQ